MSEVELNKRIAELNVEDFIWIIYLVIIFMSFYSNYFERKFFLSKNKVYKAKYQKVLVIIFSILIVVYIYFLKESFNSLKNLRPNDSQQKKELTVLSFLGSLFIAVSGFIFLYISVVDENLDVELAFN